MRTSYSCTVKNIWPALDRCVIVPIVWTGDHSMNGLLQPLGPASGSHANLYIYTPSNIIHLLLHCNWQTETGSIMQSRVELSVLKLKFPFAATNVYIQAHSEKSKKKIKEYWQYKLRDTIFMKLKLHFCFWIVHTGELVWSSLAQTCKKKCTLDK
jgi:hypothetical protein